MKGVSAILAAACLVAAAQDEAAKRKELADLTKRSWDAYTEIVKIMVTADTAVAKKLLNADFLCMSKVFSSEVYDEMRKNSDPEIKKAADLYKTVCDVEIQRRKLIAGILIDRMEPIEDFESLAESLSAKVIREFKLKIPTDFVDGEDIEANESAAASALKTLCNAEPMFRSGGGLGAYYYVADIAGFCWGKVPSATTEAGYVADRTIAMADDAPKANGTNFDWDADGTNDWTIAGSPPAVAKPRRGYLFGRLTTDETGAAYAAVAGGANTGKYGFYARPATYRRTGRRQFHLNESGQVCCKDTGNNVAVTVFQGGGGWTPYDVASSSYAYSPGEYSEERREASFTIILASLEAKKAIIGRILKSVEDRQEPPDRKEEQKIGKQIEPILKELCGDDHVKQIRLMVELTKQYAPKWYERRFKRYERFEDDSDK